MPKTTRMHHFKLSNMPKLPILVLATFAINLFSTISFSQKVVVSGFVEDKSNGERLTNAVVYLGDNRNHVLTNNYGFYSILAPAGQTEISYSYVGFNTVALSLKLHKDTLVNIRLEPNATLSEVLVTGSKTGKLGKIEIIPSKLKEMPSIMGETDLIKALQYYPGVQSGMEGRSGLYVRGGGPDQNLVLLDGVPVYNVNHLFGFFSIFNPVAISSVSLYKSDIPARYSGYLSSVLDIQMKEGNNKEWKGDFTLGLIASKLTIEGPLKKEKSSVIFSARRTYLDILMAPILAISNKTQGTETMAGYYFQDINLKLNYRLDAKNHLYLSFYTGLDKAYINDKYTLQQTIRDINNLKWGNLTSVLRWNHVFSSKLFSNTHVSYSQYKYQTNIHSTVTMKRPTGGEYSDSYSYRNFSGINSISQNTRADFYLNSVHHLQFGFSNTYFVFTPGSINYEEKIVNDSTLNTKVEYVNANVYAYKANLYVEDQIDLDKLKLNIGAHYSGFLHKGTYYQNFEPRVAMKYLFSDNVNVNLSYTGSAQYIHLVSNSSGGLPTDLWLPVTENVKPATSVQYTAGISYEMKKNYRFSLEAYYKTMDNLLEYKEGASYFTTTDNWENSVTQGKGTAYGLELFVEKKLGKFTGFAGYTLAWAWRKFEDINMGREFPYKFDRRHDMSLVGHYRFNERINLGAVWVYGTGNSITLPTQRYTPLEEFYYKYGQVADILEYYGNKNSYKLPAYHRLDVNINLIKQKMKGIRTWSFGVYNLYNRQNPYLLYVKEMNGQKKLYQRSLFPAVPYFSYNYKF
jgi:hypothetical protein